MKHESVNDNKSEVSSFSVNKSWEFGIRSEAFSLKNGCDFSILLARNVYVI